MEPASETKFKPLRKRNLRPRQTSDDDDANPEASNSSESAPQQESYVFCILLIEVRSNNHLVYV